MLDNDAAADVTNTGAAHKFGAWLDDSNVAAVVMPKDGILWAVDARGATIDTYELSKSEPPFDLQPVVAAHAGTSVSVGQTWQGIRISITRRATG